MGEELEVALERCLSPAPVAQRPRPTACCCAWRGSCGLSPSVPRPGGLWMRGLSERGNKSPGRDRCAVRVCTPAPCCRHVDAPRSWSALHRAQPGQKCGAGRVNKSGLMPGEFTLSAAQVFLPFSPPMFFVFVFSFGCIACGILVPRQGTEPRPRQ